MIETIYSTELYHHGVKGMKWGVRKDNRDGLLRTEMTYGASETLMKRDKKAADKQYRVDRKNGVGFIQRKKNLNIGYNKAFADHSQRVMKNTTKKGLGKMAVAHALASAGTLAMTASFVANPAVGLGAKAVVGISGYTIAYKNAGYAGNAAGYLAAKAVSKQK